MAIIKYTDFNAWKKEGEEMPHIIEDLLAEFTDNGWRITTQHHTPKEGSYFVVIKKMDDSHIRNDFSTNEIFNTIENVGPHKTKDLMLKLEEKFNNMGFNIGFESDFIFSGLERFTKMDIAMHIKKKKENE